LPSVGVAPAPALDALAWLRDSEVAVAVERALSHSDDEVFQAGLRAAGTLPLPNAVRLVSRGLDHSAWNVRMLATKLLLDLDTKQTRKLLTEALANESDSMVRHAIESGLQLGG
jgi:HEAT repeat protein